MHAEVNWVFTKLWVPVPNGVAAQHAAVRAIAMQGVRRAEVALEGRTKNRTQGKLVLDQRLAWTLYQGEVESIADWYSPLFSTRAPTTSLVGHETASPSTRLLTQLELP
jgi:hypothetical protein